MLIVGDLAVWMLFISFNLLGVTVTNHQFGYSATNVRYVNVSIPQAIGPYRKVDVGSLTCATHDLIVRSTQGGETGTGESANSVESEELKKSCSAPRPVVESSLRSATSACQPIDRNG